MLFWKTSQSDCKLLFRCWMIYKTAATQTNKTLDINILPSLTTYIRNTMKSNSTETKRRKKNRKKYGDVKSKHTAYTTCTAFLLSHKTKNKTKKRGAQSVCMSVLPDYSRRSLKVCSCIFYVSINNTGLSRGSHSFQCQPG